MNRWSPPKDPQGQPPRNDPSSSGGRYGNDRDSGNVVRRPPLNRGPEPGRDTRPDAGNLTPEQARSKAQFFSLTPDRVLDAVELAGLRVTGMCYPLNSLENRVYEIEREDRSRVVAKFYRPGRWSEATILEEHTFLQELADAEIPVCPPLRFRDGYTLKKVGGTPIWYALFPKVGGRAPEEFSEDQLRRLGALLARIHTVGAARTAPHRRALTPETYGLESLAILEKSGFVTPESMGPLHDVTVAIVQAMHPLFFDVPVQRVHGDCHPGNLLWGNQGAFFLDFDDMVMAPPVQDVWMIVPSRDAEGKAQRDILLEGYRTLRQFDHRTLRLVEALRALRYLHYAAWISTRWDDPSFPRAFPHFDTPRYWNGLVSDLEEQLELVQEAASSPDLMQQSRPIHRMAGQDSLANRSGQDLEDDEQPASIQLNVSRRVHYDVKPVTPTDDDWQRLLMIRTEVFVEELDRDLDAELDGKDRTSQHLLASTAEGKAAGCVRLRTGGRGEGVVLDRLAVLYPHRRKGVAKQLFKKSEELARTMGEVLTIESTPDAVEWFEARGYSRIRPDATTLRRKA